MTSEESTPGRPSKPCGDQTYSFAVHRGVMHTGTSKEAKVFRYLGPNQWEDTGRLGSELEVKRVFLSAAQPPRNGAAARTARVAGWPLSRAAL